MCLAKELIAPFCHPVMDIFTFMICHPLYSLEKKYLDAAQFQHLCKVVRGASRQRI